MSEFQLDFKISKKSMDEILQDDNKLKEYINFLENDIDETFKIDEKIDEYLKNVETLTDNFKDRRALKGSLISSVNDMVKLKSELPERRIKTKKLILDIMTRKKELELKTKQLEATNNLSGSIGNGVQQIFQLLDNSNIHPLKLNDEELKEECSDIIDDNNDNV